MPTDGLHLVSSLTGWSREEAKRLWEEVRANQDRLATCSNHGFVAISETSEHRRRYRCMHCRGEIDANAYRWYMCGRQHATDQLLDAGYRPPV